ncbi:C-type lectin domain family 1 member A-like [Ctenodactylus gundi]
MEAKYSNAEDTWEDDWYTTPSLPSRASTISWQPEHRDAGPKPAPPSPAWRPVALTLLALSLVLLIGLAALGLVFFQFYQLSSTQRDTISQKEERVGNLSQQLQALQIQNQHLEGTLQRVAEKLCRELYKSGGHKCSPCSAKWKWHGDNCYQFYRDSKSWQECEYVCVAENSTMLKINTRAVLDFAMPQSYSEFFYSYWTGLSRNGSGKMWHWTDGAPHSSDLFEVIVDVTSHRSQDCVTILNGKAFSKDCRELRRCACQRRAGRVDPAKLP